MLGLEVVEECALGDTDLVDDLLNRGPGLGTLWGEELAVEMLTLAGFSDIAVNHLKHDFQNNFYVMKK